MSESNRLSKKTRHGLIDLGWERPEGRKAKRPEPVAQSKLVQVEDLIECGALPTVDVEHVA